MLGVGMELATALTLHAPYDVEEARHRLQLYATGDDPMHEQRQAGAVAQRAAGLAKDRQQKATDAARASNRDAHQTRRAKSAAEQHQRNLQSESEMRDRAKAANRLHRREYTRRRREHTVERPGETDPQKVRDLQQLYYESSTCSLHDPIRELLARPENRDNEESVRAVREMIEQRVTLTRERADELTAEYLKAMDPLGALHACGSCGIREWCDPDSAPRRWAIDSLPLEAFTLSEQQQRCREHLGSQKVTLMVHAPRQRSNGTCSCQTVFLAHVGAGRLRERR